MSIARRSPLLAILLLCGATVEPAEAQGPIGPPAGGPTGQFLGPPSGNSEDFLGTWSIVWQGPTDSRCPCRGTLIIDFEQNADGGGMVGYWKMGVQEVVLRGPVSYNQTVWIGRFAVPSDTADFPFKGHFRLATRGSGALTGSYQRDGTAVPFALTGNR
jgi:hypothetical protein